MFGLIEKYRRLIQALIVLLAITFAAWGIESYTGMIGGTSDVAKVDDQRISERDFANALRQQQERLRQVLGTAFDPAAFDTPQARRTLLDSMIEQRLIAGAVIRGNLTVTDEALREAIANQPAFQVDGKFTRSAYETVLRAQNPPLTPARFEAGLRHDLALAQLATAVAESAIAPRSVTARIAAIEGEQREISEALVPAQKFASQVTLDEAKLKAYYDAHPEAFRKPERLRAEYLVLSAEEFARRATVDEAELKAAYESRAGQFKVDEQRRASHILVQVAPEAKEAERQAARARIEELLAQVRKTPARFAELARKHSQDTGSAEKGGDLGFFGRGMMVKPFEEAVYRLQPGEISEVVESEFGLHIIRLEAVRAGSARPFAEVRDELETELRRQKGARRFAEIAEGFTNSVYEQADSLKPAAERFKLELRTSDWISRGAGDAAAPLNHPKVIEALFGADAIKSRRNTDAIEVAPSTLVSARVLEHQPAAQQSFEEVRAELDKRLRQREAAELARKEGTARLEQLRKGGSAGLSWSATRVVSRRDPQGMAPEALRLVVSADASKLPAYVGRPSGEGYVLYRISRVIPAEAKDAEQRKAEVGAMARIFGTAQFASFIASLRAQADVEINEKNLERR
jgi:peptidyl-prolyl cis-trans isomerase D